METQYLLIVETSSRDDTYEWALSYDSPIALQVGFCICLSNMVQLVVRRIMIDSAKRVVDGCEFNQYMEYGTAREKLKELGFVEFSMNGRKT